MGYLIKSESENRLAAVRKILEEKNLDLALVYYDEFNIGNGWYLTGWCPQGHAAPAGRSRERTVRETGQRNHRNA